MSATARMPCAGVDQGGRVQAGWTRLSYAFTRGFQSQPSNRSYDDYENRHSPAGVFTRESQPRDCPQQKAAHGDLNSHNPEMERWQFSKFEDNHRFSLREW